jgi:hypothetical protein
MSDITAKRKMMLYRALATTATSAVGALLAYLAVVYPWLAPLLTGLATGAGTLIGKLWGIPVDGVLSAAIATMNSDRAVKVTSQALRSMPPAVAEETTRKMLASIPPAPTAPVAITILGDPAHADTDLPPPRVP